MVRVGIIGCGRISQRRHVPEYAINKDAEIVGYYDRTLQRARDMAGRYGGRTYETIEELLADETIDAVSICIANRLHAEVTIQALNAKKHVLIEKPMATTVEDCEAMIKAAKANGKFLMVAQNQRFYTGHARAKELLEQGIIGRPLTFKTTFCHGGPERWLMESSKDPKPDYVWFFDKSVASMGVMADLGIHKIDLIQYILGERITEVTGKMLTLDKKDSKGNLIALEDNAICILKMENGVYGTLTVSWTDYGEDDNSTVIFGTKGLMRLYDNSEHTIQISTDRGDKIYYDLDRMEQDHNKKESGMIREFVQELESGEWTNEANELSVNAIRVVLAGFESSEKDCTIQL